MADFHTRIIQTTKWGLPTSALLIFTGLFWTAEPVQRTASAVDLSQVPAAVDIGIQAPQHHGSLDKDVTVFMTADRASLDKDNAQDLRALSYFASFQGLDTSAPVELTANLAQMVSAENRMELSGQVVVRLPDGQEVRSDKLDILFEDRTAEGRGRIHTRDHVLEIFADYLYLTWSPESAIETVEYKGRVRSIYIPQS